MQVQLPDGSKKDVPNDATVADVAASIGKGLGEHRMHTNGEGGGMGMSPAEAQAKIKSLQSDKAWATSYLQGDAGKKAEMERLHKIAFPSTGA